MGEERGVYRVLVGKTEGKRPLGRPRRRWVDNKLYSVMNGLGMWRVWERRGDAWGVGGETGGKETTGET